MKESSENGLGCASPWGWKGGKKESLENGMPGLSLSLTFST